MMCWPVTARYQRHKALLLLSVCVCCSESSAGAVETLRSATRSRYRGEATDGSTCFDQQAQGRAYPLVPTGARGTAWFFHRDSTPWSRPIELPWCSQWVRCARNPRELNVVSWVVAQEGAMAELPHLKADVGRNSHAQFSAIADHWTCVALMRYLPTVGRVARVIYR